MRKILFWFHLVLGLSAGLVIAWMAATGTILAFQPLVTEWAAGSLAAVPAHDGEQRLDLDTLLAGLREKEGRLPSQLTLRNDPRAAAVASFGRERTVYVDPYTGEEKGEALARVGAFFGTVERLHRWFALSDGKPREIGRTVVGAACLSFSLIILGGLFLWWRGHRFALQRGLRGKARDWSLHNVFGLWASPILLLISLTGIVMAFPWANALLFRAAGSPVPEERRGGFGGRREGGGDEAAEFHAEAWLASAQAQVPGWQAVTLRLPPRGGKGMVTIVEPSLWVPHPMSQLSVDAETGDVQKWEPYAGQSLGRRLRGWVRPLHTGESFGVPGALLNVAAALAALLLVWTGFALSWRRFFGRKS